MPRVLTLPLLLRAYRAALLFGHRCLRFDSDSTMARRLGDECQRDSPCILRGAQSFPAQNLVQL